LAVLAFSFSTVLRREYAGNEAVLGPGRDASHSPTVLEAGVYLG